MISIKNYAEKCGVSYEAVRKQVSRYRADLGDHIIIQGRTQYLDDEAVLFLDNKRAVNPVIIVENEKNDQIEELKEQNENLKIKIMELQDQLIRSQDQLIARDRELMELKDQILVLTTETKKDEDAGDERTEELSSEETEPGVTTTENEKHVRKTIFSFLWKKRGR